MAPKYSLANILPIPITMNQPEETTPISEEVEETQSTDQKKTYKLDRFELPGRLFKNEETESDTYAQFVAEPLESGYGHTLGNSLRRVLLSCLEGAAITSVSITGAKDEFAKLKHCEETVTDIILNIKKIKFQHDRESEELPDPTILTIQVNKKGVVTAGDIKEDPAYEILNKDLVICTLTEKTSFECQLLVQVSRGFNTGDENKNAYNENEEPKMPKNRIFIDSIFSPVTRVKYAVEQTRVGDKTDYDKLILDVYTDGRVDPSDAVVKASRIFYSNLDPFVQVSDAIVEFESAAPVQSEENASLKKLLAMSVNEIELSVRAANCLNNANITTVGQLATKSEPEMLKYRNFGKKSLNEIKDKLVELGLGLGMNIDPSLLAGSHPTVGASAIRSEEDTSVGLVDLIAQNLDND